MNISQAQDLLNIKWPYDQASINSAYRKAAFKYHPDRGGDSQQFLRANEAKETLNDSLNNTRQKTTSTKNTHRYEKEFKRRTRKKEDELTRQARNRILRFRKLIANRILSLTKADARFITSDSQLFISINFGPTQKVPGAKNQKEWGCLKTEDIKKSLIKELAHYIRTGLGWPKYFTFKNQKEWGCLKTEDIKKSLIKELAHYIRTGSGWPKYFTFKD